MSKYKGFKFKKEHMSSNKSSQLNDFIVNTTNNRFEISFNSFILYYYLQLFSEIDVHFHTKNGILYIVYTNCNNKIKYRFIFLKFYN